jgi:hypothetical protein
VTLALALILFGLMLIYAGVKGYSIGGLLMGKAGTPSTKPAPARSS